jgi:hypothetical protein
MPGLPDEPNPSDRRVLRNWTAAILAVHGVILLVLIGLVLSYPPAAGWISDAVHAEFVGAQSPPAPAPQQLAQPAGKTRTVRAN